MKRENQYLHKTAANTVRAALIAVALAALPVAGTALAAQAATPDDDCIAGSCGLPHFEEPRQGRPSQHVL